MKIPAQIEIDLSKPSPYPGISFAFSNLNNHTTTHENFRLAPKTPAPATNYQPSSPEPQIMRSPTLPYAYSVVKGIGD